MIWLQIQAARTENLGVVFLNLANGLGSALNSLLRKAFSYFHVPEKISVLVKAYFEDIQLFFNTSNYTTSWQHLEIDIMAGCSISSLAFTMAAENAS